MSRISIGFMIAASSTRTNPDPQQTRGSAMTTIDPNAGALADEIIAKEVAGQDKMWGLANDRADSSQGQLLKAGIAQGVALIYRREGHTDAFTDGKPEFYPADRSEE